MSYPTGRRRRTVAAVLACALALPACASRPDGAVPDPAGGSEAGVTARGVSFQPDLVTVTRSDAPVVLAVDPDGAGFLLDGAVTGVPELRVDQVLLVTDELVGRITERTDRGSDVHIRIAPVGLTEVFQEAEIEFNDLPFAPDQHREHAWDDPVGVEPVTDDQDDSDGTGGAGGGFAGTTTVNAGDYKLDVTFEPAGPAGFDLTVGLTRNAFSVRVGPLGGSQPSGRVAGVAKVSMRDIGIHGNYRITDGKLVKGSQRFTFNGQARFSMTAVAGDTAQLAYREVLSVPWETYRTIIVSGVPFLVLVRVKFLVAPAVSGVGTTLMFRTHVDFTADGTHDSGYETDSSGTGGASNDGTGNRVDGDGFGVAGMLLAVRPRLGIGFGVPGANTMAFGDAVISASVLNGSSIGITQCRKLTLHATVRVGAEAKFLVTTTETSHPLYDRQIFESVAPPSEACKNLTGFAG